MSKPSRLQTLLFLLALVSCLAAPNRGEATDIAAAGKTGAAKERGSIVRTGTCPDELAPFDELMVKFMRDNQVPGAALAVLDDDRLVLARGYGEASKSGTQPIAVQPHSLFRLASLSKPITAVAVLQLVRKGKIRLQDHALDLLADAYRPGKDEPKDPRWKDITVLQLLHHRAGFDRGLSFDPMFRSVQIAKALKKKPPASAGDVIRYMYRIPLDHTPGEKYAYSNFGYNLLGRIIENATGQRYEDYVREHVFQPIGVTTARIGKTRASQAARNEVSYYVKGDRRAPSVLDEARQPVPLPYGAWYLEAMDAHGGWIASAVDLARFIAALHHRDKSKLLDAARLDVLWKRPTAADAQGKAAYYACGWMVRPRWFSSSFNAWHNGALAGTSTIMVRRHDGKSWIVLFNTRDNPGGKYLSGLIDPLLHRAAAAVKKWPTKDLFETYR